MLEKDPSPIRLVSKGPVPLLPVILSLILVVQGVLLVSMGYLIGWSVVSCAALLVVVLVVLRSKGTSTLVVTFGGFSVTHAGQVSSFIWSDIDEIHLVNEHSKQYVAFTLTQSGKRRCSARNIFLSTASPTGFGTHTRLPDNYALGAAKLRELLIEWKTQGSRRGASSGR